MTEYEVRFVGPPIDVDGRSLGAVREALTVEASGRADAYVQAYRHLSRPGQPVTVACAGDGENPLGLSDEEVREVLSAGAPLEQGPSPDGYRIESLTEAPAGSWKPVIAGMLATPVLLAAGIVSAGGGHGTAALMLILFPFAMLVGARGRGGRPAASGSRDPVPGLRRGVEPRRRQTGPPAVAMGDVGPPCTGLPGRGGGVRRVAGLRRAGRVGLAPKRPGILLPSSGRLTRTTPRLRDRVARDAGPGRTVTRAPDVTATRRAGCRTAPGPRGSPSDGRAAGAVLRAASPASASPARTAGCA